MVNTPFKLNIGSRFPKAHWAPGNMYERSHLWKVTSKYNVDNEWNILKTSTASMVYPSLPGRSGFPDPKRTRLETSFLRVGALRRKLTLFSFVSIPAADMASVPGVLSVNAAAAQLDRPCCAPAKETFASSPPSPLLFSLNCLFKRNTSSDRRRVRATGQRANVK